MVYKGPPKFATTPYGKRVTVLSGCQVTTKHGKVSDKPFLVLVETVEGRAKFWTERKYLT
jgi:hypothetical protein